MPSLKPISYKLVIKAFETEGFLYNRTRGDHLIYTRPDVKRPLVIPKWDAIPVFILKNLIRTAGMTRERFLALIGTV